MRNLLILAASVAVPAVAQEPADRSIQVVGNGVDRAPPDMATMEFWIRGEGQTSDAAAAALQEKQRAVFGGLAAVLGRPEIATGSVVIIEARDPSCDANRGYGSQPRLSQGACAIVGFLATMQGSVRTNAIDKAATAAGLAARLGASDARLTGYLLTDPNGAQRRATAAALADAKRRAEAAASGAGVTLGPLQSVRDQGGFGAVPLNALSPGAPPPPPPAPPRVPVTIDVKPQPIETRASVSVTYAIAR